MAVMFFNTLTRKKEEFKPIDGKTVRMYSCGPTVYNYAHIGNLRAYIFVDLLRRYLKYKGYTLDHVMNITDVDDKTIRDSQKEKKKLKDFTDFYTREFLLDLATLNITIPERLPHATDEIDGMVDLIEKLLDNGFAYKTPEGDIYFKISKFADYGKLANLDLTSLKKNADGRLDAKDEYEKEDARDFALWKSYSEADGDVFWDTRIGKGRPGWHIECSAMSSRYLGQPFDIHTGGVDLIFPHHTNEIAQSEAAGGKKFVNCWMHNEHLMVNGQKMAKSAGNFYTLRDLLKKGHDPMAIRYEMMSTHYRAKLDFREDNLQNVQNVLQRFYDFFIKLEEILKSGRAGDAKIEGAAAKAKADFEESLDDDLNVSGALAAVFEFMKEINKQMESLSADEAKKALELMQQFDSVFGFMEPAAQDIPDQVKSLAKQREEARKAKNWALSDKIRDELKAEGYAIEDSKEGPRIKKL